MSSFSLMTGSMTDGSWGVGARDANFVLPMYWEESDFCAQSVLRRKQYDPNAVKCKGCGSDGKPHEWDVQELILLDKDKNYITITWDDGEGWYKVTDMDGNDAGWCEWMEPDSSDTCGVGLDRYIYAYYMECETTVGMTFD